jgi:hypothetical protein
VLHEIIHTLGFVAECAPHHTRAGHVSDYSTDLMYAGSEPWKPESLDIGHDDYYGHSRAGCPDLADSAYLARPDTSVDTALAGATVERQGHKRFVHITLDALEPVNGTARLVRGGKLLASKSFVATTTRAITLSVPRNTTGGRASIRIELTDQVGNTTALTKRVRIPPRSRGG